MKPTRAELLDALMRVETDCNADVLFDPEDEGERERYDAAQNTLNLVTALLSREAGLRKKGTPS